jgi:hypothetical protein
MAEEDTNAGAPVEGAAVDALYRPFAEFAGWGPLGEMHRDLWERFSGELDERRRLATPNQLAQAVMVAVRFGPSVSWARRWPNWSSS